MVNERDIRLQSERRKEFERAARAYDQSRDTRLQGRKQRRSAWARLIALFL